MQEEAGESYLPDPRVLGWLLAAHTVLETLPSARTLGQFVAGALRDVPGVESGGLCLTDHLLEPCREPCPALECGYAGEPAGGCAAAPATRFLLGTAHGHYGQLVLRISDPLLFKPYQPFVGNFAGSLALLLENRRQRGELEQTLGELRASEKRFHELFTEMTAGHAVHEIILDEAGVPCDYRFLEVNPAFERLTGLAAEHIVGRRVLEVLPGLESSWVERYGQVALTGEPLYFDDYNHELDRHYDVVAYRPEPGQFAVIFTDVSERRRMEDRLSEASEELAAMNEELQAQNEELQTSQQETAVLMQEQRTLFERLQAALLNIPQGLPGVSFGHLYQSATKGARIGGDFYDVFEAKGGRIALLIGDVCGQGLEAARTAALVKDVVHAFAHQFRRPHLVLRETNRLLVEKSLPGFVTVFLGFLDPETGLLAYSSAGHPPPLLSQGGQVEPLSSAALPLGVFSHGRYRDTETVMSKGSLLLLYTDGLTEARRDGDFFGEARLASALGQVTGRPTEEIPLLLVDRALSFAQASLRDDVALLAVSYLGRNGGEEP